MKNKFKKAVNIFLVILVMTLIFILSNENGNTSTNTSSAFIQKLLLLFNPEWQINEFNDIVEMLQPFVRKTAHFSLYALLGFVIYNVKYKEVEKENVKFSFFTGVVYAVLDELHQILVPGRAGRLYDILIDSLGVITGILIYILFERIIGRIYMKIKNKKDK